MGCRKKCAFRFVAWLLAVVLCVHDAPASELVTKSPRTLASVCLNGMFNREGNCVCNPGYSEYRGNCFRSSSPNNVCPPGTVMWKGFCHYRSMPPTVDVVAPQEKLVVVPPLRIEIPIPDPSDPLDPNDVHEDPEGDDDEPEVIMPPNQGHNVNLSFQKVVSNHNVIDNATTIHTHNVNNVVVHFSRKRPNGGTRTVVIRNNETTVYDEEENESDGVKKDDLPNGPVENTTVGDRGEKPVTTEAPDRELPCCTIVSPRVCRKRTDEWVCFHRKQYMCSAVCTANVMYLRPRKPSYTQPWLIMPPMPNPFARFKPCRWGQCPALDCSGCMEGGHPCHPRCYTYDCMADNSCQFIDQDIVCPDPSNPLCAVLMENTTDPWTKNPNDGKQSANVTSV